MDLEMIGSELEIDIQKAADEKAEETKREDISLAGRRVLLTEDNDINMEIATEVLAMYDVEVIQAWNGKEAVERFENFQILKETMAELLKKPPQK